MFFLIDGIIGIRYNTSTVANIFINFGSETPMNKPKIAMFGAGSGFVINVARELAHSKVLQDAHFVLVDVRQDRLAKAETAVRNIFREHHAKIKLSTAGVDEALDGTNYIITSCEINRWAFWLKDLKIAERHGVYQIQCENGGPGGQIHALRNIGLFMDLTRRMEKYCPDAWLMNFTNPMSFLCTYLNRYTRIKTLGFCHQVHGSFGLIAEQLGMAPGDLEVITGGINHFNWLLDVRQRGSGKSYLKEFLDKVRQSKYWHKAFKNIPRQEFTLKILETFGAYPVGYDEHIVEYLPFFYERNEWETYGYESCEARMNRMLADHENGHTLEAMTVHPTETDCPPFPRDPKHPYYAEKPCQAIEALETNAPTYLDAVNIVNHGSITNLPTEAIVDIPAVIVGGIARGLHVGALPLAAMELCRRQITLHELIAQAAHEGDANRFLQALCLDPYVRSITQAERIWTDYLAEYRDYLPMFK